MNVVVLNASYEPLGGVSFQHAVKMLFREVAVAEEVVAGKFIGPHPWPKVIRLIRYVTTAWLHKPAGYSRSNVMRRDRHLCAYCGGHATTLDHVLPVSRGGGSTWLNTVAACGTCNHRKAARTPAEAGMRLRFEPFHPTRAQVYAVQ
jgi:5-methylcytosine-specific restriction endonuclease McrA